MGIGGGLWTLRRPQSGHRNGELCAKRHTAYALTCGGILTDKTRTCHGQRRTCDGHQTGGRRAGIRLMPTFCDIPRWAAADLPRACLRTSDGRAMGGASVRLGRIQLFQDGRRCGGGQGSPASFSHAAAMRSRMPLRRQRTWTSVVPVAPSQRTRTSVVPVAPAAGQPL